MGVKSVSKIFNMRQFTFLVGSDMMILWLGILTQQNVSHEKKNMRQFTFEKKFGIMYLLLRKRFEIVREKSSFTSELKFVSMISVRKHFPD